jgi:hypothetical protein
MKHTPSLNIDDWKIKIENRSRNRMKFQIKLGNEESEAFKNFMNELKPAHISEDDFVRSLFYKGVEKFQMELFESMQSFLEENKDMIDASAVEAIGVAASGMQGANPLPPEIEENLEIIED